MRKKIENNDKGKWMNSYRKSIQAKVESPAEFGNVNLHNRPVLNNSDGSISTVNSISFNDGKHEVLVPTVGTNNGIPYQMSDNEAINNYYQTGQHLGKFNTVNGANKYAEWLHKNQEKEYRR